MRCRRRISPACTPKCSHNTLTPHPLPLTHSGITLFPPKAACLMALLAVRFASASETQIFWQSGGVGPDRKPTQRGVRSRSGLVEKTIAPPQSARTPPQRHSAIAATPPWLKSPYTDALKPVYRSGSPALPRWHRDSDL